MFKDIAVIKKNGRYYVHDDPETGKWEFFHTVSQSKDSTVRLLTLMEALLDHKIIPMGITEVFSEPIVKPDGTENVGDTCRIYIMDDFLFVGTEGLRENTKWQWLPASALLKIGNLDNSIRRYLETTKKGFINKFASGPKEAHRSVSAVITDGTGKILVMEHPYQKIWSIPKGHIDDKETAREAVLREMKEELGITVGREDAVLMTWYVEKYRNGDTLAPVKHYIYRINKYEGKITNAEKDRWGNIKMKWLDPKDIPAMKDISLMTLNAVKNFNKKAFGKILPAMALTYTLGNLLPYIAMKSGRKYTGAQYDKIQDYIKDSETGMRQLGKDTVEFAGDTFSNAKDYAGSIDLNPEQLGQRINRWWEPDTSV